MGRGHTRIRMGGYALGLLLVALGCDGGADYDGDGFVEPEDCDDNAPGTYPGAEERPYDGVDQDCDGADLVDQDGDGFQGEQAGGPDCNDYRDEVHPGAEEIPYDGVDGDCDGWSDYDYDHDGYLARGEGGEDCDDFDPRVFPIDLDGDGYTPCSGDCDEADPYRYEDAEPVCGNGIDDDCDEVSDCALVGILAITDAPIGLVGTPDLFEFGWNVLAPGDVTGDGVPDLLATGKRGVDPDAEARLLFVYDGLLAEGDRASDTAWAELAWREGELVLAEAGDVEGDARAELLVGEPAVGDHVPRAWLLAPPDPGAGTLGGNALLEVVGDPGDETGSALDRRGDRLVIGAPSDGDGTAVVLPLSTRGTVAYDEAGALLVGPEFEYGGAGVHLYDAEADGTVDLLFGAPGDWRGVSSAVYLLEDPPTSGVIDVADAARARVDTHPWQRAGGVLASGDFDGDGDDDPVLGGPWADDHVGALAVFTEPLDGELSVDDAPIRRLGLGDDAFGESVLAEDFDGDGLVDLIVGAPASWDSGGGAYKPGAVHVWYGPVEPGVEHTITADLYLTGTTTGVRTLGGRSLALGDLDGDGGVDLAIGSPRDGAGRVDVFPGGQSGLLGM